MWLEQGPHGATTVRPRALAGRAGGQSARPGRALSEGGAPAADTPVCQCDGVPRAEILPHRAAGSRTVESIATATRATTGCGGCRPLAEEPLAESARPGG
ncbi:(2Fe-2S)-binding protein [Streptomyces sp. NPDC023723]|uniref:(2Fe-2S)-binding protein n=1 Tax=Streptomyces sp. NPDC023723 TaxID=3154323 RepID=UPI00340B9467